MRQTDTMTVTVDCLVIGAGVVGLAVARRLSLGGRDVVVVDEADGIGTQTSSRNSEVIHAGICYPRESAKARHCVAGRQMLYRYCNDRGIDHRRIGKLIVATDSDQLARLDAIAAAAAANGVDDLRLLSRDDLASIEPGLDCAGALHSPSTGIIDSHGLMRALHRDAEDAGATTALRTRITGGHIGRGQLVIELDGTAISCRTVVNAAGLGAWDVARGIEGLPPQTIPRRFLAKGNYFVLDGGRVPFSQLVYPVPVGGGLGVHLTLDLAGQARFGPDVEWTDHIDYHVDAARADQFYAAIRRYWPGLPNNSLVPAYCGIRPKLSGPGDGDSDFLIQGPAAHGTPGLVNLFGIESPGLTSCLPIAEAVTSIVEDR
jgi:L-2-hydroxyglutarate oxidase LhgO